MRLVDLFEDDEKMDLSYIIDTIENECSDMLEVYQDTQKVLYRGADNKGLLFSKANIRQDRRPVEMPPAEHELITKAMAELDLPTRSNSLFVSADRASASSWGSMNVIFVPNGWKGLVYDALRANDYSFGELKDKAENLLFHARYDDDKKSDEEVVDEMKKAIKMLNPRIFTHEDLGPVLKKNTTDILIQAPAYYRLNFASAVSNKRFNDALRVLESLGINGIGPKSRKEK